MISAVSDTTSFTSNRLIAALGTSRLAPARRLGYAAEATGGEVNSTTPVQDVDAVRAVELGPVGKSELTEDEKKQVEELAKRDREVRQHEQSHKAAAGQYAQGGPSFKYQVGPDGKSYAIGGEVKIDTSAVPDDPEATIRKMQQVRQAAMAPAKPSAEDRQVASQAAATAQQARSELTKEQAVPSEAQDSMSASAILAGRNKADSPLSEAQGNPLSPKADRFVGVISQDAMLSAGRFIDVRA